MVRLAILDENVAQIKFNIAKKELELESKNQKHRWKLRYIKFPYILIDVLTLSGKPALVLSLYLANWDFQAPSITLLHKDLYRPCIIYEIPIANDPDDGRRHIYTDQNGLVWFCSPGFNQYHERYLEDKWEYMRNTDRGKISWIVDTAISHIERRKLHD